MLPPLILVLRAFLLCHSSTPNVHCICADLILLGLFPVIRGLMSKDLVSAADDQLWNPTQSVSGQQALFLENFRLKIRTFLKTDMKKINARSVVSDALQLVAIRCL
jgi:hypothetical protein